MDAQLFDDNDDDDGPSATLFPSLPKWVVATLINYKFPRKSPLARRSKLTPTRGLFQRALLIFTNIIFLHLRLF